MLGTATLIDLAAFRNASRPPEAIREMLQPLADTSLPGLSRDFHKSPDAFHSNALFSGRVVFFASALAILVPAGFAEPLLKVWLGSKAPALGETIYIQMAAYQALQMYLAIVGVALFAAAKRQFFIPLMALNAIVSVAMTLPVYQSFGISGIGSLKLAVSVVQTLGLWWVLVRIGFPQKAVWGHAFQIVAIFVSSLVFVAAGVWGAHSAPLMEHPALSLLIVPVFVLLAMALIVRLRIAVLPDRIERRLNHLKSRLVSARQHSS